MKFIFLTYVSRSGSTMLARKLAAHSPNDTVIIPEFRLLEILLAEGEAKVRQATFSKLYRLCMLDHQISNLRISEEDMKLLIEESVGKGIRFIIERVAYFIACNNNQKPMVAILKLGSLIHLHSKVKLIFPESAYLHIMRDPRGVANSMLQSNRPYFPSEKMGRGDVVYISLYWKKFISTICAVKAEGGVHEVRYEDLLLDIDANIKNICSMLGVEYQRVETENLFKVSSTEKKIHKLAAKPVAKERSLSWMKELKPWKILVIEFICKADLDNLGYQTSQEKKIVRLVGVLILAGIQYVYHTVIYYLQRILFYIYKPRWLFNRLKLFVGRR